MAASRESIDRLYTELFGRPADDGGAAYWMKTGLTGEELRDQFNSTRQDKPKRIGVKTLILITQDRLNLLEA